MLKKYRTTNIFLWVLLWLLFALIFTMLYISIEEAPVGMTVGIFSFAWVMFFILELYAENRFQQKLRHYILKGFSKIELKHTLDRIQREQKALQAKIDTHEIMMVYDEFISTDDTKTLNKIGKYRDQITYLNIIKQFYLDHKAKETD